MLFKRLHDVYFSFSGGMKICMARPTILRCVFGIIHPAVPNWRFTGSLFRLASLPIPVVPHEAAPEVSKGKVHTTQNKHVPI